MTTQDYKTGTYRIARCLIGIVCHKLNANMAYPTSRGDRYYRNLGQSFDDLIGQTWVNLAEHPDTMPLVYSEPPDNEQDRLLMFSTIRRACWRSIRLAASGRQYKTQKLNGTYHTAPTMPAWQDLLESLLPEELEVVGMLLQGKRYKQIADELNCHARTVYNIFEAIETKCLS